jgi:alpha-beta hydrolase superfamily lysophospholipase
MTTTTFHVDSFVQRNPGRSEDEALDQAMLRAYSIERSVDYGCSLEDVLKLRRWVEAGNGWVGTALLLADDNEQRALRATQTNQALLAMRYLGQAAACCRLAQAGLEADGQHRVQVYERQASLFRRSVSGFPTSRVEFFEVGHHGKPHAAWLFRPTALAPDAPTVVIWGGADGWCEAFHGSVPFYAEQGLAVCLLELPGQGLARLRHGSVLGPDFGGFVSAALDALTARGSPGDRFGVVGHSAGGSLALAAAGANSRIRACCSNGGSVRLLNGLKKYPRVLQRFSRMMGEDGHEEGVSSFLENLNLEGAALNMQASLLCLQGGLDPLVNYAEAQQLVDLRSPRATLEYWPEGVHCLYNHATERNSFLAEWFARQLG